MAKEQSRHLQEMIRREIEVSGGIAFDRYMELVLYAPGVGYYAGGARKFGAAGDFVTAPEVSPLFARCIARQCAQVLQDLDGGDILEFGAGSGVFAADLLEELAGLDRLPDRYLILEVSEGLRQRQEERLRSRGAGIFERVVWLDTLPEPGFAGMVIANEVLDAMPVNRFQIIGGAPKEQFVTLIEGELTAEWSISGNRVLEEAVSDIEASQGALDDGFESEINLRLEPWIEQLSDFLDKGAVLLIDYGYPRREYYHPLRSRGTLMCHYRHRAHPDPLILPGLQDITAHVDFSAVAEAAHSTGLMVEGYTTQAYFLMNSGLDEFITRSDPEDVKKHLILMQQVKQLTLPTEMGERFKVLGLSRGLAAPLSGFNRHDQSFRL